MVVWLGLQTSVTRPLAAIRLAQNGRVPWAVAALMPQANAGWGIFERQVCIGARGVESDLIYLFSTNHLIRLRHLPICASHICSPAFTLLVTQVGRGFR